MTHFQQLAISLPHGENEPAASFASRQGAVNACHSLTAFCRDMGLLPSAVVHGEHDALSVLERLCGLERGLLARFTARRYGDDHLLNGQFLKRQSLRREHVHVCPLCIADDVANGVGPMELRPHDRMSWRLTSVRSCARHAVALIPVSQLEPGFDLKKLSTHDFPSIVRNAPALLKGAERHVIPRQRSPLEAYLLSRLWGHPTQVPFLDAMPWYAAARASEMLGAALLVGPRVRVSRLSDEHWFNAGIAGFEILSGGAAALRNCLEQFRIISQRTGQTLNVRRIYGRPYEWLAYDDKDPAYDAIRHVIEEHAYDTVPLGPDDLVFGKAIPQRRLHTVHTAHRATRIQPRRVRTMLDRGGITEVRGDLFSGDEIVFSSSQFHGRMDRPEMPLRNVHVSEYLNAPRIHVHILREAGLIGERRWMKTDGTLISGVAKDELDAFLSRLLAGAIPIDEAAPGMVTITDAAVEVSSAISSIVRLILERKLRKISSLRTSRGYGSILVDAAEVKRLLRRPIARGSGKNSP